ncbi:MAG: fibronectin type III domain-containing protein [Firmicutes bacterium]|nr:fibronectin type III domain-containing protein [Bacillota bacterium]
MTEPELISPLLDGFAMGSPMSEHDGVSCCPAIKENSEEKYIVKIISVPASQVQMDALLLTGAYKDPASAMDYFKEVAADIEREAEFLQKLSKLEGFLPYDAWQTVPITRRRLGYEVYLVSPYKKSLAKYIRRNPVTHLEAVNLGLDLCSALSVCRQAGRLYVDLKPTNIFLSEDKGYRIGDLGFIPLDALKYTPLPDKYRSPYSPPELHDPMSTLNETADTYAVGMILYQLYNDGSLPFHDKAPEEALPSPVNADYELAEIILKAIDPDPAKRWQDPKELGQALVAYMQRNAVNDTPITIYTPIEPNPEDIVQPSAPEAPAETPTDAPADETAPSDEDAADLLPHQMSEEVSQMVEEADDLIAHEIPKDTVIRNPEEETPDRFSFAQEEEDTEPLPDNSNEPFADAEEEKRLQKLARRQERKQKTKKILVAAAILAILTAIGGGVFWGYRNYYLQTVNSISIEGDQFQLVVKVDAEVDESLLSVVCMDNYGNALTQSVVNGQAVFTDLLPDSLYRIQLKVSGLHKLVGQTSDIFTTDSSTKIVSFSAVTGPEDGSVMLNFTVSGGDPDEWVVTCTAEGEETRTETFSGHTYTVKNLTVGKKYTFTLEPAVETALTGENTLEFMASRLVLAENLTVAASSGSDMTVRWDPPGDVIIDSWNVRCYSDSGYDKQLTVTDTEVYFTDIDPSVSYTIEVTAAGMTQPARTSITANPINISNITVDEDDPESLTVSWTFAGEAPSGGWLLMYSIDGSETPNVVKCTDPSAKIAPRIPSAKYQFTVQAADGTSIFGNVLTYKCPGAAVYEGQGLSADKVTAHLLKTPEGESWSYESVGDEAFTDRFTVGDKLSAVLYCSDRFYVDPEPLNLLYVIRDGYGNVIPGYVSQDTGDWKEIWYDGDYHYGELNIPTAPDKPGEYSLSIYFNGLAVTVITFTVSE